jgi:hypothetical protein
MLTQVAEGVQVHQSALLQNNTVVVQGRSGVLRRGRAGPPVRHAVAGPRRRGPAAGDRRRHAVRLLVPMLDDFDSTDDPIEDYLVGLGSLESVTDQVHVVIPGHGSVGGADQVRARIEQDRAYLHALRDGRAPDDPRIGPSAKPGWEWVSDIHAGQAQRLAERGGRDTTPG